MDEEIWRKTVTWEQVDDYVNSVVAHIKKNNIAVSGVFGPPRGGLVFAVMLSHRLNIPLLMHPFGNCIIVDDIADTGKSLCHYRSQDMLLDTYFITTMFWVKTSLVKPDFYWKEKTDGSWLIYPWENFETEGIK